MCSVPDGYYNVPVDGANQLQEVQYHARVSLPVVAGAVLVVVIVVAVSMVIIVILILNHRKRKLLKSAVAVSELYCIFNEPLVLILMIMT